jgi:hypothetical protein
MPTTVLESPCGLLDPGPAVAPPVTDGGAPVTGAAPAVSGVRRCGSVFSAGSSGRVYFRYLSASSSVAKALSRSPSNCTTMTVMLS